MVCPRLRYVQGRGRSDKPVPSAWPVNAITETLYCQGLLLVPIRERLVGTNVETLLAKDGDSESAAVDAPRRWCRRNALQRHCVT